MRIQTILLGLLILTPCPGLAQDGTDQTTEIMARKLINSQGCKACHTLEGAGSGFAGELRELGQGLTGEQWQASLVNPQHRHGDGRIPDFSHLRKDQIEALVRFLTQPGQP